MVFRSEGTTVPVCGPWTTVHGERHAKSERAVVVSTITKETLSPPLARDDSPELLRRKPAVSCWVTRTIVPCEHRLSGTNPEMREAGVDAIIRARL